MLTPAQLDRYPEAVAELFAAVEQDILADMARRICRSGMLTDTARWQFRKAKEMGQLEEYILQELSALSAKSWAETKRIFEEAGVETVAFDDHVYEAAGLTPQSSGLSPALKDVVAAGLRKTKKLYKNLTKTIANTATKQFEDALDRAYLQVASGAFTPQEAARRAVKQLASDGMQTITYPSGHRDHMDVAIRRALLTGLNQTCAEVQLAHADEMGSDLVQVTSHLGARPAHAVWQGKIFSLSGKHPKYPDFVSSTGYGTGPGLCGWNCRHNFFPFFEGFSIDNYERYDEKENNRVYEESQKQRAMERAIRRDKRACAAFDAAGLRDDFERAAVKLKQHEAQLRGFLKQTGRTRRKDRERVIEFGHSQSSKAVWAAKKQLKEVESHGIIKDTSSIEGVSSIRSLGHIRVDYLEREFGKLRTSEIVVTPERIQHIRKRHPDDYALFEQYSALALSDPDCVLKDHKNENTILMVKKLEATNLNVVVRLILEHDRPGYKNSVMTFYRLRDRNLEKLKKKSKNLYEKE